MSMQLRSFILVLAVGICSCKKTPFDFRNKYLGDFGFIVKTTTYQMSGPSIVSMQGYCGTISYGNHDNTVSIEILDNVIIEAELLKDGTLRGHLVGGQFSSGKKHLQLHKSSGAQGGGTKYEVIGDRRDL